MHLFYTPDIDGNSYFLNEEESKHCIRVLRLQAGDNIQLIDGKGGYYQAIITDPHPKRTQLNIVSHQKEFGRRNHFLHLAVAPTKNIERFEWFLEKATEIGIDEITPVICDRSERKEVKTDRLLKVITSAVKQSIKAYHPRLNPAVRFKDFLKSPGKGSKFIAHCMDGEKSTLQDSTVPNSDYIVMIGPEGDFTPEETALALSLDTTAISLGDSRLRTETAALAACFEINFLNR